MLDFKSPKLMTTLASLGEIAIAAPSVFEMRQKQIITHFVVKDLLMVDRVRIKQSQLHFIS